MITWLKNLFSGNSEPTLKRPVVTPKVDAAPKATADKSSTTTGSVSSKKDTKKSSVTKTDLNKMSKHQLEAYAKKEFKVDIDRRKKKADLVAEVSKLAKK